jgi:hypothetical protein
MDIRDFAKELEKRTLILGNLGSLGTLGIYSSFTSRKNPAKPKTGLAGLTQLSSFILLTPAGAFISRNWPLLQYIRQDFSVIYQIRS